MVARNLEVKVFFYNGRVQLISGLFIVQLLGVDTKLYFFALSLSMHELIRAY